MKKLYRVEYTYRMMVVAEDVEEAKYIFTQYKDNEFCIGDSEIMVLETTHYYSDWKDDLPFGKFFEDEEDELTCKQWADNINRGMMP